MGEHAADLAKKLQVIDAMKFMATSWGSVTTETIQKCFKACGFDKVCDEENVSHLSREIRQFSKFRLRMSVNYVVLHMH